MGTVLWLRPIPVGSHLCERPIPVGSHLWAVRVAYRVQSGARREPQVQVANRVTSGALREPQAVNRQVLEE